MKKRLAKKAFSRDYYSTWINPRVDKVLYIPRNARCYSIIRRACRYYGHPEYADEMINNILAIAKEGKAE